MAKSLGDSKLLTLGTLAATSGLIYGAWWYKKYLKNQPPTNWIKIGEVGNLYIYPVKSCGAVKQESLECTFLGTRNAEMRDRMFVIVYDDGKLVTGRDHPEMVKITTSITGTVLKLSAEDCEDVVELNFGEIEGNPQKVRLWGVTAEGVDCGDEVAVWLSKYILGEQKGIRMLYYGKKDETKDFNKEMIKFMNFTNRNFKKSDSGQFSDALAFHLISDASIKELNTRVESEEVYALQFRPNIVVKGEKLIPFEEDSWEWIKINDIVFQALAPCTRCLFTTVNPNKGTKSENTEPLKTLRRYRLIRDSGLKKILTAPAMGIYLGARTEGYVHVGDDVYIPA